MSPAIEGNIAAYYQYLYANAIDEAKAIADLFGAIDFSVTENDLCEILPSYMSPWISNALVALDSVLAHAAGQGGFRIFHESFRRFMLDELSRQGRNAGDVLQPVIQWLEGRGFLQDAKSFRFLLPALRRAGRNSDALNHIGIAFVSDSVIHGHPPEAIQKNLAIAADIAGRSREWPLLVRFAELRRALSTCFDVGQNSWTEFWSTYVDIHGAAALAERLLFDGKPTQSRDNGLMACALVDDGGAIAPWREYLDLPRNDEDESYDYQLDDSDGLTDDDAISLAALQGRLRLGAGWRLLRRAYVFLRRQKEPLRTAFIRALGARLARMGHEQFVLKLATRSGTVVPLKPAIDPHVGVALRLGAADEFVRRSDHDSAREVAELALLAANTPELAIACVEHGANQGAAAAAASSPEALSIYVGDDTHIEDSSSVRQWIASVRLLAGEATGDAILDAELRRVVGQGWYRCWLRWMLAIARAETLSRKGESYNIADAFSALAEDVRPFAGTPRPCDLYRLHGLIKESLALGLSLVRSEADWESALETLRTVNEGTSSRIDREDGGPVPIGTLVDLLLPYVANAVAGAKVLATIQELVELSGTIGTYYSVHAEYSMRLAKAQVVAGHAGEALENWRKAGVYLAAYGWRKDITLFDIIESAPALGAASHEIALSALSRLQPLVAAVLRHTDGRSTNRSANAWFRALLQVDSPTAIELLARTIIEDEGIESWSTIDALEDVTNYLVEKADPLLVDALWETIGFKIRYDNDGPRITEERLAALRELYTRHPELASQRLVRLAAEVANDTTRRNAEAADRIESFAAEFGEPVTCEVTTERSEAESNKALNEGRHKASPSFNRRELTFPVNGSFVDLLAGLRRAADARSMVERGLPSDVILHLGYRLVEMAEKGEETDVRRLLNFCAHELDFSFSEGTHPLADLARYLENAGHASLAAISYALAYASSRGGGGWLSMGDSSHSNILHQAIELDREIALQTLADEVSYRLRHVGYGAGISRHLIERTVEWGEANFAAACWDEAFNVISHRLPLASNSSWFATLDTDDLSSWTLDQGLVVLLLVRLGEPRLSRKVAALAGLLRAIRHRPDAVAENFVWWMSRDTPISSLLLVLHLVLEAEESPYPVTALAEDQLQNLSRSECWGVARLASYLFERAGREVPPEHQSVENPYEASEISEHDLELALSADQGGSLEVFDDIWPELKIQVAKRFHAIVAPEIHKERIRERFRLAFGREGQAYPETPVLYWQTELLLASLHAELFGLKEHLWKIGSWSPDLQDDLFWQAQPDVALHLAAFNSRVARPAIDEPNEVCAGEYSLHELGDDPRFLGWTRLGLIERQYVQGERTYARPVELVTLYSGVQAVPLGRSLPLGVIPFGRGSVSTWWSAPDIVRQTMPPHRAVPLVSLDRSSDWLGSTTALIPPAALHIIGDIQTPGFGDPFLWADKDGQPVVALRTWKVRSDQFDAESNRLEGSELIVRPDMAAGLQEYFGCPLRELRRIDRQVIPPA